jgi:hypothetical protein
MDLAKNLTIRSQEAELAFLLEARSSKGKDSFRVRVHKLTAQLEAQAGCSKFEARGWKGMIVSRLKFNV